MADVRVPRLNKVMLSGWIANDIELKYTPKGTAVVKFAIGVEKNFKDSSGQWQKQSSFLDIVAWEKWAEALNNNARKGSPIIVEGRIDARTYVDKDNNNRKAVEITAEYIQFLEYKPRDSDAPLDSHDDVPLPDETSAPQSRSQVTNDDVPF